MLSLSPALLLMRIAMYTPPNVPLGAFLEEAHARVVRERFSRGTWKTSPERDDVSPDELVYVHFPVEETFWRSKHAPHSCVEDAVELAGLGEPRAGRYAENKFSCGNISHWRHVWSIGSNGMTQFEEYTHMASPNATISVFDCTLTPTQRSHVSELERMGVLKLYDVCMGGYDSSGSEAPALMGHGAAVSLIHAWDAQNNPRPTRRNGTPQKMEVLDYLKIDCEGCEMSSLLPFFAQLAARYGGEVPITQLQIEIHLGVMIEKNRTDIAAYSAGGIEAVLAQHSSEWIEAYRRKGKQYRALLAGLQSFGFVPFHIDMNHKGGSAAEFSFANIKCPSCRWPVSV